MHRKLRAIFSTLIATVLIPVAAGKAVQAEPLASRPFALKEADESFARRRDPHHAREALESYRKLYSRDPKNPEFGWRVAMSCYFNGYRLAPGEEEQKKLFSEGMDAAEAALKNAPGCAPCHFWLAINIALRKQLDGSLAVLGALGRIREELEQSIRLDPNYGYGAAFRLQGILDDKVPGIFGGSRERAKLEFEKAILVAPGDPLNYLFLARLYEESLNDPSRALEIARRGASLPPVSPERVESVDAADALKNMTERLSPPQASARM